MKAAAVEKKLPRDEKAGTQLLNAVMSYARIILRKYGELAPFGFSVDREGNVKRETLEIPRLPRDPERMWKLLAEHMATRVRRGQIEALAMAANVTLAEPSREGYSDAVVVEIEHEGGYGIEVTVPYRVYGGQVWALIPRRIALGETQAKERVNRLFSA